MIFNHEIIFIPAPQGKRHENAMKLLGMCREKQPNLLRMQDLAQHVAPTENLYLMLFHALRIFIATKNPGLVKYVDQIVSSMSQWDTMSANAKKNLPAHLFTYVKAMSQTSNSPAAALPLNWPHAA